jgi:nucleotide-binding universal stress UspA family protein
LRELVQRSPRPILAIPAQPSPLSHALLAYNGSPKSKQALYLAAYMAGKWQIKLSVITVLEDKDVSPEVIGEAQTYLDQLGISADYIVLRGSVPSAILITTEDTRCDFIILGGYSQHAIINVLIDKIADQVMRKTGLPMVICQ